MKKYPATLRNLLEVFDDDSLSKKVSDGLGVGEYPLKTVMVDALIARFTILLEESITQDEDGTFLITTKVLKGLYLEWSYYANHSGELGETPHFDSYAAAFSALRNVLVEFYWQRGFGDIEAQIADFAYDTVAMEL